MDISSEEKEEQQELSFDGHECEVCDRLKEIEKNLRIVLLHLDEAKQRPADKNKIAETIGCLLSVYEKVKKMIR